MTRLLRIFFGVVSFLVLPMGWGSINSAVSQSLHIDWIDPNVSAKNDFYTYANGGWLKENHIPPAYPMWNQFTVLQQRTQTKLNHRMALLSHDQHLAAGSILQKIGDFYYSGMNMAARNAQGAAKLLPLLQRIDSIATLEQLESQLSELQRQGVDALFNFGSMQDLKNSQWVIAAAMQGGLGLPDRDYYLSSDKSMQKIRFYYQSHIAAMLTLVGESVAESQKDAVRIMAIETALAKASMSQIDQRDPYAVYHVMSIKNLKQLTPHFDWQQYLNHLQLPQVKKINIGMPSFFKTLDKMLVSVSLSDWKAYLRWHVLEAFSPYLSDKFVQESFKLSHEITGAQQLLPLWQRVESTVNIALDNAVGQWYVKENFSETSKQQALVMMEEIRQLFRKRLLHAAWMQMSTRQAAVKKLDAMLFHVGYPSHWRDYANLTIGRDSYVNNVIAANQFNSDYDLQKIDKPVDPEEWSMSPQTVNAYYDPSKNSIHIPAGILQPPFFDSKAPRSLNYGTIGFVIGHEMTHGFDDQGALFDAVGNLRNWWTKQDLQQFKNATQCIADQYSTYHVQNNLALKGSLVVGEATADLGGILLAYEAFHSTPTYHHEPNIDGFTPDQQFFLGVAHVWAGKVRPAQERLLITTDPHPPLQCRVNGSLANIPAFAKAFQISSPSVMVHQPGCKIW